MTAAARVRLVETGDFAAIAAITNHWIRTTAIHFGYEDVPEEALRSAWREHDATHPWLVTADDAGTVLGYAKAGEWRTRAAYAWTTETGIYLRPDARGRGLGAPLYARLLAVLRAQGFHGAIGGIALPNPASVRLHERLGFVAIGTFPRVGRKHDRWHDVGFWHLPLQPHDHVPQQLLPPARAFAATDGTAT
jgi:L-amino acid N-acyltransferase YncA